MNPAISLDPVPPLVLADPWFQECLATAATQPSLVAEFDRLTGSNLSTKGSGIELMIDKACGRMDVEPFVRFVYDTVYLRMPHPLQQGVSP